MTNFGSFEVCALIEGTTSRGFVAGNQALQILSTSQGGSPRTGYTEWKNALWLSQKLFNGSQWFKAVCNI